MRKESSGPPPPPPPPPAPAPAPAVRFAGGADGSRGKLTLAEQLAAAKDGMEHVEVAEPQLADSGAKIPYSRLHATHQQKFLARARTQGVQHAACTLFDRLLQCIAAPSILTVAHSMLCVTCARVAAAVPFDQQDISEEAFQDLQARLPTRAANPRCQPAANPLPTTAACHRSLPATARFLPPLPVNESCRTVIAPDR